MCGIAGLLFANPARPVDRDLLRTMSDAIGHRGPDGEGFFVDPGVGLAHRRLAIIDVEGGSQPIGNEDGSVQVVFNGEIYNFRELRRSLEAEGHHFRTSSDTEVLVHLYEKHGESLVDHLRGMFAFALWDRRRRLLLLARDRLGLKPLYYYRDSEILLFGSEPKAILAHPGVAREVAPEALEDYLAFGVVLGERSIFRGIHKLPPAHVLAIRPEDWSATPRRYWRLEMEADPEPSVDHWVEAIRAKMEEAVRLHLIADVPVGAFLSGGVDSSVIVALAAGRSEGAPLAFSMGFAESSFNELPQARRTAAFFGVDLTEEIVAPDAVSLLDEMAHYYDEPFADSSAIPTYLVARLASRSVKVVLTGDGGDEAFGGYARYQHDLGEAAIRALLPKWFRRLALGSLGAAWPRADWLPRPLRAKTALSNLAMEGGGAYANTLMVCREPLRRRLLAPGVAAGLNGHRPGRSVEAPHAMAPADDPLAGMIAADVETLLPDDYLVKVDRASMAHGVEARPPFLDHELMELAARIPSRWKISRGETKWILKRAFADRLPAGLLNRPKQGFEVPIDAWLRGPLRPVFEEAVLAPGGRAAELLNQDEARRLHQAHLRGVGRHGAVLWSLLVLARWAERHLPSQPRGGLAP